MITLINKSDIYEYHGISTDTKPLNCPNGSIFLEMDTSKIYFYDAAGAQWLEWGASA